MEVENSLFSVHLSSDKQVSQQFKRVKECRCMGCTSPDTDIGWERERDFSTDLHLACKAMTFYTGTHGSFFQPACFRHSAVEFLVLH